MEILDYFTLLLSEYVKIWRFSVKGRDLAISMFLSALHSVHPKNLIPSNVSLKENSIIVEGTQIDIPEYIYVFGSGKASVEMAKAIERILKDRIKGGVIVCNYIEKLKYLQVIEGSHPIPDEKSLLAGDLLYEKMSNLKEDDFFIYLLSGGSSALIEKLIPPVTLEDLQKLTNILLKHSVPIEDINVIRKHISLIKGGRLGRSTKAKGVVLVISDVIGDDLFTIGSAPLYYDKSTYEDAYKILEKYSLLTLIPKSVLEVIERGLKGEIEDTPKSENPRIKHFIIGNNLKALKNAREFSESRGVPSYIMTSQLKGEAREVAKAIVSIGKEVLKSGNPYKKPVSILFGGETTVTVHGNGKGGRNQEMCLSALNEIKDTDEIVFLSCGTDGIDGNSEAAGAVVDKSSYERSLEKELDIDEYLKNNDSYSFFYETGDLILTGYTGTNVMDITILIIGEKDD